MIDNEQDTQIRIAAFKHVQRLSKAHDHLTRQEISPGFIFNGERVPLVNPQRGIFKPQKMQYLLSIRTVYPKSSTRIWYDDQKQVHQQIFEGDQTIDYDFMGQNPDAADNRWLREAYENKIPIIYFLGISPGRCQAFLPVFISGWSRTDLKVQVCFGDLNHNCDAPGQNIWTPPENEPERRYALRVVKQRLHQARFRDAVITAYGGRCALSGLPEKLLLDAAHIIPDNHKPLGQPIVQNGLPLSKIHHAAFDAHLIGIDPDYKIHISDKLLAQNDGPMLETLKKQNGQRIYLPNRKKDHPDQDRLAERFERFEAAA